MHFHLKITKSPLHLFLCKVPLFGLVQMWFCHFSPLITSFDFQNLSHTYTNVSSTFLDFKTCISLPLRQAKQLTFLYISVLVNWFGHVQLRPHFSHLISFLAFLCSYTCLTYLYICLPPYQALKGPITQHLSTNPLLFFHSYTASVWDCHSSPKTDLFAPFWSS